jgi:hypothetical protein
MVGALRIGAPLVLASLLLGSLPAGAEEWSLAGNTNFRLEWNAGYNSNVIELSERDIDRFREGRLDFTTDLATWDDLAQSVGARFSVNSPGWAGA